MLPGFILSLALLPPAFLTSRLVDIGFTPKSFLIFTGQKPGWRVNPHLPPLPIELQS